MSQLINFENYKLSNTKKFKPKESNDSKDHKQIIHNDFDANESFKLNLEILVKNNPDKIVFSIQEATKILGVGEEFIRRRIKAGKIKSTYLGDKPFINIVELAHIITEGV